MGNEESLQTTQEPAAPVVEVMVDPRSPLRGRSPVPWSKKSNMNLRQRKAQSVSQLCPKCLDFNDSD